MLPHLAHRDDISWSVSAAGNDSDSRSRAWINEFHGCDPATTATIPAAITCFFRDIFAWKRRNLDGGDDEQPTEHSYWAKTLAQPNLLIQYLIITLLLQIHCSQKKKKKS